MKKKELKKEFDLRKALMGHPLKTRDGYKVLITGFAISTQYPLIGVVATREGVLQLSWTLDGKWSQFNATTNNDLLLD